MSDLIMMDIDASLKRFCVLFGQDQSPPVEFEDFDTHADDNSVPKIDLIGTSGLALSSSAPFVDVEVMIGVSTLNDTNLLRLRELVARLFQRLQPTKTLDVFDYKTGEKIGNMIVQDGVRVLPVGEGQSRPVQYVMVAFKTDCFAE
jgi:hypothetical protein